MKNRHFYSIKMQNEKQLPLYHQNLRWQTNVFSLAKSKFKVKKFSQHQNFKEKANVLISSTSELKTIVFWFLRSFSSKNDISSRVLEAWPHLVVKPFQLFSCLEPFRCFLRLQSPIVFSLSVVSALTSQPSSQQQDMLL